MQQPSIAALVGLGSVKRFQLLKIAAPTFGATAFSEKIETPARLGDYPEDRAFEKIGDVMASFGALTLFRRLRVAGARRYRPPQNPQALLCRRADLQHALNTTANSGSALNARMQGVSASEPAAVNGVCPD